MATRSLRQSVQGLSELKRALEALATETQTKIGRRAVSAGARVIRDAVKAEAPVAREDHFLYSTRGRGKNKVATKELVPRGNLKKNIVVMRDKDSSDAAAYMVTVRHKGAGVVGQPYAEGIFNEFGTVRMSANPFMRRGFAASAEAAARVIESTLKVEIEKATKK